MKNLEHITPCKIEGWLRGQLAKQPEREAVVNFRDDFATDRERASSVKIGPSAPSIRQAMGNEASPGYGRMRLSEVVEGPT